MQEKPLVFLRNLPLPQLAMAQAVRRLVLDVVEETDLRRGRNEVHVASFARRVVTGEKKLMQYLHILSIDLSLIVPHLLGVAIGVEVSVVVHGGVTWLLKIHVRRILNRVGGTETYRGQPLHVPQVGQPRLLLRGGVVVLP